MTDQSKFMAYLVNGGDETARAKAGEEYCAGLAKAEAGRADAATELLARAVELLCDARVRPDERCIDAVHLILEGTNAYLAECGCGVSFWFVPGDSPMCVTCNSPATLSSPVRRYNDEEDDQ